MTPKDRIKSNIYKILLEEEKRRNKRMSLFSVGLFFMGIVSVSTYNNLVSSIPYTTKSPSNYNFTLNRASEDKLVSSMYSSNSIIKEKTTELNPDDLFSFDTQI